MASLILRLSGFCCCSCLMGFVDVVLVSRCCVCYSCFCFVAIGVVYIFFLILILLIFFVVLLLVLVILKNAGMKLWFNEVIFAVIYMHCGMRIACCSFKWFIMVYDDMPYQNGLLQ